MEKFYKCKRDKRICFRGTIFSFEKYDNIEILRYITSLGIHHFDFIINDGGDIYYLKLPINEFHFIFKEDIKNNRKHKVTELYN